MPPREIEKGETIGSNPSGRKLEKGYAAVVEGVDRKPLIEALGRIHDRAVSESERVAKLRCPLGDSCQILANTLTSSDSFPSEVVFECPGQSQKCGEVTLEAAKDADRQISQANRSAVDAVTEIGR